MFKNAIYFLFLFCLIVGIGCSTEKELTPNDVVQKFYSSLNEGKYNDAWANLTTNFKINHGENNNYDKWVSSERGDNLSSTPRILGSKPVLEKTESEIAHLWYKLDPKKWRPEYLVFELLKDEKGKWKISDYKYWEIAEDGPLPK